MTAECAAICAVASMAKIVLVLTLLTGCFTCEHVNVTLPLY